MSFLQQDVPLSWYLLLSAVLFSLGVVGFLIKRNLITVFMSIELMLNAVNLSFVTFAYQWHAVKGQIFVFFVMMVAAAEAAVGLAIIIAVFRARATLGRRPHRPDETMNESATSLADSAVAVRWASCSTESSARRLPRRLVTAIGTARCRSASFALVLNARAPPASPRLQLPDCGPVTALACRYVETSPVSWIAIGALHVDFTFVLDQLSLVMLLVVTGVGFLIHIYSVGYMHDDPATRATSATSICSSSS